MLFSLAQTMKKPKRKMKKKRREEEDAQPCSPIDAAAVPSPQIPRQLRRSPCHRTHKPPSLLPCYCTALHSHQSKPLRRCSLSPLPSPQGRTTFLHPFAKKKKQIRKERRDSWAGLLEERREEPRK
jgi:hypothetical protein